MRNTLSTTKTFFLLIAWLGSVATLIYLWSWLDNMVYDTVPNEDQSCSFDKEHITSCLADFQQGQEIQKKYIEQTGKYKMASEDFIASEVQCSGGMAEIDECLENVKDGCLSELVTQNAQRHGKHITGGLPPVIVAMTLLFVVAGYQLEKKFGILSQCKQRLMGSVQKDQLPLLNNVERDKTTSPYQIR